MLLLTSCVDRSEDRLFKEVELEPITQFSYPGRVTRVFGGNDDFIYLSGDPLGVVLKYNLDGEVVDTVGEKGNGPEEFSSIWWYHQPNDSTYYNFDYTKNKIRLQATQTDSLLAWQSFNQKSNVIGIGDSLFVTTRLLADGDFVFSEFDFASGEYKTIQSVSEGSNLTSKTDLDFVYYGEFSKSERKGADQLLYYCLNAPLFFTLSPADREVKRFSDFRDLEVPTAQRYGKKTVLEPSQLCFIGGGFYEDNILLLTTLQDVFYVEKNQDFFIDLYDSNSGKYKESIRLPSNEELYVPTDLKVFGNFLVIVYSYQNIAVYDLEEIL